MRKRTLQIDVKRPINDGAMMECNLYVDGSAFRIYMTADSYETLRNEKFFIRDGKTKDSAGVLNTTNTFEEKEDEE